jgi:hypothetical protein
MKGNSAAVISEQENRIVVTYAKLCSAVSCVLDVLYEGNSVTVISEQENRIVVGCSYKLNFNPSQLENQN